MNQDLMYVERVKKGDTASFRYLVDKYQNMAFTIAFRVLRCTAEAEDAAQEGFVKAYQQLHRFEGKAKFSTWLYTIMYRTAIDKVHEVRLLKKRHAELDAPLLSDSPAKQMIEEEQRATVRKAIHELPPTDSLLITLYYMNECSVKEIASIMGMSEIHVKVKMFRARKTLQQRLQFLIG